ncbi:hypothetical protein BJ123_117106 [Rhodopseudomonas thermotolerans]|uniref:Uncharacterized protein n=3 Tax=Nitrobacteraceae TaxID=41294 RepID=A0A336JR56_9BRAD|nr:hypothetical protein BJ125_117106 [Rhodopseudomonas pentothenatexigens]REF92592.1 hypothetical protein BJ123_117106 [Rhodopseudomonas thermotolerans]SSW92247.1 hypothetical protein SAMN05892882_117106 [Rhodopseudomonas pentothenatexigens]
MVVWLLIFFSGATGFIIEIKPIVEKSWNGKKQCVLLDCTL